MTAKEILVAARELISDEKNWTHGVYMNGPFCALHALYASLGPGDLLGQPLAVLHMAPSDLITFNDNRTHAEVLALFDKAIARAG